MDHQLEKDNPVFLKNFEKHGTDESIKTPSTIPDEKELYIDVKIHDPDAAFAVGDVFESGPRLIDLGADGKERPIRTCGLFWVCVLSNIWFYLSQRPTLTMLFD